MDEDTMLRLAHPLYDAFCREDDDYRDDYEPEFEYNMYEEEDND